jgi:Soluble lytic murein transglycosylase and related regulatory proteins (some contain LysM/invasin domains)
MKEGKYLALKKVAHFKLISIAFLALSLIASITYMVREIDKINQLNRERQAVSNKVTTVMQLFNCNSREIHDAIMETFDPVLIAIVIGVESEYRIDAISPAGCRGLMQLTSDKLDDWRDVHKNIQVGSKYLEQQLNRFGSLELAIAAYNAGPEAVTRYQGVPPYTETRAYVQKAKLLSLAFNHFLPWTVERERQVL